MHDAARSRFAELIYDSDPVHLAHADILLATTTPHTFRLLDTAETEGRRAKHYGERWTFIGTLLFWGGCIPHLVLGMKGYEPDSQEFVGATVATLLGFVCGTVCFFKAALYNKTVLRRAALGLANANAPFAADYLLEGWQTFDVRRWRATADEQIERALLTLLADVPPGMWDSPRAQTPETRRVRVRSCFPIKNALTTMFRPQMRIVVPRGEFSDTRADLLVTLLRHLAASQDEKDREVVAWLAQSRARTPNQTLVRDAAQVLLEGAQAELGMTSTGVPVSRATQTTAPAPTVSVGRAPGNKP